LPSTLAREDSLHAIKGSPANANSLPNADERVLNARNLFSDRCLEILDLLIGDGSPAPFTADEAKHPGRAQDFQPFTCLLRDTDKRIAIEHRDFHVGPPVTPLADLFQKRQKCDDRAFTELLGNTLFMPRHRLDCIPAGIFSRETQRRNL
jgi:hypothetical protein